jgi:hypothetical protein
VYLSRASRTSSVLIKAEVLKEVEGIVHLFIREVVFCYCIGGNETDDGGKHGRKRLDITVDILKLRVILK